MSVYSVVVSVNGREIGFSELPPAEGDRVRVPLKDFALAAGIEFSYDAAEKTASLTRGALLSLITSRWIKAEENPRQMARVVWSAHKVGQRNLKG